MISQLFFGLVASHGMLLHPGPMEEAIKGPSVRNYVAIDNNIDSLRSPYKGTDLCRSQFQGPRVSISLENGKPFTVTTAFSIGAQHIGPCKVEILDPKSSTSVLITELDGPNGCARPNVTGFDTNKESNASHQCPGLQPPGLITNDMCMDEWTFTVTNAEKISCTECVLRWSWIGQHVTPNEFYENCVDVSLSHPSSPSSSSSINVSSTLSLSKSSTVSSPIATSTRQCKRKQKTLNVPGMAPIIPLPTPTPTMSELPTIIPTPTMSMSELPNIAFESIQLLESLHPCHKGSNESYYKCSQSGYWVCFPFSPEIVPVFMHCASGTACVQSGSVVSCL